MNTKTTIKPSHLRESNASIVASARGLADLDLLAAKQPAKPDSDSLELMATGIVLTAEAQPVDGKPAKARTFKMVAYTGGAMMLGWRAYPTVVDLAGMDTGNSERPILIDHVADIDYVLGQTSKITKTQSELTVEGSVFGDSERAQRVIGLNDRGFKFQASIGCRVLNMEFVQEGATATANGKTFNGPINIARKTLLGEVSFVVLGADDNTSARIAAHAAKGSPMTFEQWLEAKGFSLADLSDQQKASLKAAFDAELKAAATQTDAGGNPGKSDTIAASAGDDTLKAGASDDSDPIKARRKALADENRRVATIDQLCAGGKHADIAAKAIEEGWTVEKTELEVLRASRPQSTGGGTRRGAAKVMTAAVIEAAMCLSIGCNEKAIADQIPAADREQVMNAAQSSDMRGYSLHALMDAVLHATGEFYNGSRKSNGFIRAALQAEQQIQASGGGFSTVSLSGILSNVANKGLIAAYTEVEVVWPQIAAVRNNSDFKAHTRYRLDTSGAFRKVAGDGELKHIALTDASYTNTLATYGAIVALTRQMMINDDLGAFMSLPQLLGRLAAVRLEEAVMTLLLGNAGSFFGTANGNYMTGATTALSISSLSTGEQKFSDFVVDSKPVLVSPSRILVGTALKVTADNLFKEQAIIASSLGATNSRVVEPAKNPHVGKYPPFKSPYINNTSIKDQDGAAISNQSSTRWYLFADPAVRAALAVAFLNGQRTPTIESAQTDFSTLGMQWRAFHDFGVAFEEPTGAVMSDGA